jgi:hypothetical protein
MAEEVAAVVREAGCGLAVDTADPAAVAAAVRELGDPARRAALGQAGRAAALHRFGWAPEAARLVALYRTLVAVPGRTGMRAAGMAPGQGASSVVAPCLGAWSGSAGGSAGLADAPAGAGGPRLSPGPGGGRA